MLKFLDKVASTMTTIIVVATTITTTLLIPILMVRGVYNLLNNFTIKCLVNLLLVSLCIHINKSIQGGN